VVIETATAPVPGIRGVSCSGVDEAMQRLATISHPPKSAAASGSSVVT